MNRAYALLSVKTVDEDERTIEGTATTPEPDRVGDIVEPLGIKYKNPMPLLHHHHSDAPVGTVRFDKPTKDGVEYKAKLARVTEPGLLKDRVDLAWAEIKHGLVRGVSIGFRVLEDGMEYMRETGGFRFTAIEVMELSLVTIPAHQAATIAVIKSLDDMAELAAPGTAPESKAPGVSGTVKVIPRKHSKQKYGAK